jgi:GTP cyclohydrolase I
MQLLNLDLSDDSLMETPHRIAKMYVDEIFSGLDVTISSTFILFSMTVIFGKRE